MERLREKADKEGVDLLVVDTGDRIDGNGLYDASDPKGVYTYEIFKQQQIDIICTGNHELYKQNASESEFLKTVPNFRGNYIASNVDIFDPKTGNRVPLAPRFKKFTTRNQGIRVLAFGFLFDFIRNANNTVVQFVADTIKEVWFQDAIRDRDLDLFLISGHVPLRSKEFNAIFKAIREVQWDTPIHFFGGHSHIRDYSKYDSNAFGLESGRYMETVGFASITGLSKGKSNNQSEGASINSWPPASPKFNRRYIDNNLYSFYHHTALDIKSFHTPHGLNVSAQISAARKALNLDSRFGCAPWDLWTNRAPFPSNQSIYTWLQDQVFPDTVYDAGRGKNPRLFVINTGALRFDIFQGPFTLDTLFTISPFNNKLQYIKNVPYEAAKALLTTLNNDPDPQAANVRELGAKVPIAFKNLQYQSIRSAFKWPFGVREKQQLILNNEDPPLSPGYTTIDDLGSDGDDTIHSTIYYYTVPYFIQSQIDFPKTTAARKQEVDPENVDIVFVDFIQPLILLALKSLGIEYHAVNDVDAYMEGMTIISLLAQWVQRNWNETC